MVTLSAVVQKRSLKIERKLYSMHRNKKTARGALVAVKRGHSLYKTTLRFKKGFALYKRVWRKKVLRRFKYTEQLRLSKLIFSLFRKREVQRKKLFQMRLFGRKALMRLYGGLTLPDFKFLYSKRGLNAPSAVGFFARLLQRGDVLLFICRFTPSIFVSREAVRAGLVMISQRRCLWGGFMPYSINMLVTPFDAVHFHLRQSELFFLLQFYQSVVKRNFTLLAACFVISRKALLAVLLPFLTVELLLNPKLKTRRGSVYVQRFFRRKYQFLYSFRYLSLLACFNKQIF